MEDDKSTSLINAGNLGKPANTLIEKVSSAVGGIFEPWQIKRVARAKAEAALIKAKSDIEVADLQHRAKEVNRQENMVEVEEINAKIKTADLQRRAVHRFFAEQAKHQENMEEITRKTLPHLAKESNPKNMENDWVTNFFAKSRIVSDEQMQNIWAQILAGEANAPGSFSKRTVNLLGDLDKRDAELFQTLCRFGWIIEEFNPLRSFTPLVFNYQNKIYKDLGIDFDSLSHLDSLGLVQFNGMSEFVWTGLPKDFTTFYYGQALPLTMSKKADNELNVGSILFTQAGKELARVVQASGVDGFYNDVKKKWKAHRIKK